MSRKISQSLHQRSLEDINSLLSSQSSLSLVNFELQKNPLSKRSFKNILTSDKSIKLFWAHPENGPEGLQYQLELGVGLKTGSGSEQFRQIYRGRVNTYVVNNLQPK